MTLPLHWNSYICAVQAVVLQMLAQPGKMSPSRAVAGMLWWVSAEAQLYGKSKAYWDRNSPFSFQLQILELYVGEL
jgi:hypothetical protein